MKTLALLGILLSLSGTCQTICPPHQEIRQTFPAMHKALELEGSVKGLNMEGVVSMMCEHKVFARGADAIVYMDVDSNSCYTISTFSFIQGKCASLEITMAHQGDQENKQRDVKRLVAQLDWLYNGHTDLNNALARYDGNEQTSYTWLRAPFYVQMNLVENASNSMELLVMYK